MQRLGAIGRVANNPIDERHAVIRGLTSGLAVSPVAGVDLAARMGLNHYPMLLRSCNRGPMAANSAFIRRWL